MTNGAESRQKKRSRLRLVLAAGAVLLLVLVVPPLISVGHYKGQITRLISRSLGQPVRLSSVHVRLLPWPGFVLYDLSVAGDPNYGAEPVLYAHKVTASIRLLALWRGRLEIGKISVSDASLNLVRAAPGRWNLDPLFRTAAAQTGQNTGHPVRLPDLEASDSRINFKSGVEKLPFSLVNADLSFWQENPAEWRIRLRGQPARTDVSMYQEETGVVRMEASVRRASELCEMPFNVDLDWRQAQLGQLARLITGSDSGWRGDLTGELHLDGTAEAAQVRLRLRATGVHRAEFAPASPLDFDANCAFVYHYELRSLENLDCDSPLGDGRVRLTGEMLGVDAPRFSVALDRIPVAAGLDMLRTLRSGFDPDLQASGTVSGKIVYAQTAPNPAQRNRAPSLPRFSAAKARNRDLRLAAGPLTGSLTVEDFALSGGGLSRPLATPKITLEPSAAAQQSPQALAGTFAIPAGGDVPLTFAVRLSPSGYWVAMRGQASFARARELAHAAGIPQVTLLDALAGDPITLDLIAAGPWLPAEQFSLTNGLLAGAGYTGSPAPPAAATTPAGDSLSGTVTLRNANWKTDYLANHVEIAQAVLHVGEGGLRWNPLIFSYGPVKGTASLSLPSSCATPQPCPAQFQMQFGDLDAAVLETTLMGAHEKGTLLSSLIDRFHPSSAPPWPRLAGTVTADSLLLGPVTLRRVSAVVRILPTGAEITSLDAGLLGGRVHLSGTLTKPATDDGKPAYVFEGKFQKLSAASLGSLLGLRWAGGPVSGNGKVELSGYTDKDLAASAKGSLHLECRRGAIGNQPSESSKAGPVPAALGRFSRFAADAAIVDGAIRLGRNQVFDGARKQSVEATVTFGDPPRVAFTALKTESH